MSAPQLELLINVAEQQELFGESLPPSYHREAAERWGHTAAWRQTAERVLDYSLTEWQDFRAEEADWERRLVDAMTSGEPADGPVATALAEEGRLRIDGWLFDCDHAMHTRVVEFTAGDASTRTRLDGFASGLADYLVTAVRTNAARRG